MSSREHAGVRAGDVGGGDVDEARARRASRASASIARVPSTLIARASSSGRSKEIEAAQWQTTSTRARARRRPPVRSPATRVTRVAMRRAVAVERGEDVVEARLGGGASARGQADDLVVGALEQPREHLHAEEAGGAGEEDARSCRAPPRAAARPCPPCPASGAPIAWKPPSTWRISPVITRARSESRKQTAPATGPASSVDQPQRRLLLPQRRRAARSRGCRARRSCRAGRR